MRRILVPNFSAIFLCLKIKFVHDIKVSLRHPANAVRTKKATNFRQMSSEFVCNICGKLFSVETNLNDHNRDVHTEVESHCNLCDKSFKSKKKLRYHTISTHVVKETFNCDIKSERIQCIYFSTTNSNLRAHKKRVHVKPIKANLPMHVCGLCITV